MKQPRGMKGLSPTHWYQAALIAFREEGYVAACTYLRRDIAANPYIAEEIDFVDLGVQRRASTQGADRMDSAE